MPLLTLHQYSTSGKIRTQPSLVDLPVAVLAAVQQHHRQPVTELRTQRIVALGGPLRSLTTMDGLIAIGANALLGSIVYIIFAIGGAIARLR